MSVDLPEQMTPVRTSIAAVVAALAAAFAAWAATSVIGLPYWVLPGAIGTMCAGLLATGILCYFRRTPPSGRQVWIGGGVLVSLFALFVVGFMITRAFGVGPAASLIGAGKLSPHERLIIADFKSPPTDATLGVTTTEALRAALDQSSALRVVPRRTMDATLQLLQKLPSTAVDLGVAREIATRDGVNAVLDGDIASLGGRYVVSLRLLSPHTGELLASFREEAASRNDFIPAIGRLAKQLRSKVGESLKSIHDATALQRLTTGSIDALSKYASALTVFDQTGDDNRPDSLLQQAVAIDSTFAMAWRRLSADYTATGQRELAARAAAKTYAYRDRLSEIERGLTVADYFAIGPDVDDERALEAYENVLTRDSSNTTALNNASLILARRRDYDRAESYSLKAAAQDRGVLDPTSWGNAINWGLQSRGLAATDSVMRLWASRAPAEPSQLMWQARLTTFGHRDYDAGEQLYATIRPKIAASRTTTESVLLDQSDLMFLRGRLREGFQLRSEMRRRQFERGVRGSTLLAGLDSALVLSLIQENPTAARAVLRRALQRMSPDSFPPVDQPYRQVLDAESFAGDTAGLPGGRAGVQRALEARGKTVERPSLEAFADGQVEFARGRLAEAIEKFNEADRRRMPCVDCVAAARFLAFDRLGQTDSAIAAGEAYLKLEHLSNTFNDPLYRPGILQRLGELYEAKKIPYKAVKRYEEFVELWKRADPVLQPRVRDARGRLERLRAEIVRKG